ncbi:unnamed protein product [Brassica oleracea]
MKTEEAKRVKEVRGMLLARRIWMSLEWDAQMKLLPSASVTANQWDLTRVLGGSSGSSAAAIEARLCIVSPGLDLWLNASSLDVIGCFVSTVADAEMLLHAISGFESKSSKHEAASHFVFVSIVLGCVLTEVPLPFFSLGVPAFYVLASSESS